jgi:hypothetical protein
MTAYEAIAEFIQKCWDEDRATLQAAGPGEIAWLTYLCPDGQMGYTTVAHRHHEEGPWVANGKELKEPASFRVIFNRGRELHRLTQNRMILQEHRPDRSDPTRCRVCTSAAQGFHTRFRHPCRTVRLLASEYDDRPGYQYSLWAPD